MNILSSTVTLTSFNAHAINDGTNYSARIPYKTPPLASTSGIFVERGNEFPVDSGVKLSERKLKIYIEVKAGTVGQLMQWFDTSLKAAYKLIVTDSSDASAWYVYARPTGFDVIGRATSALVIVTLEIADPIWRNNSNASEVFSANTSPYTHAWNVGGTKYAIPTITINPQAGRAGGFLYKRYIVIYNNSTEEMSNYPMDILGGAGFDHAALVTAGKAQADGDDWRVFMDGTEIINQWPGGGGYNSTTLKTWMNIELAPKLTMTLGTAIAGAGAVTTITFQDSNANLTALLWLQFKENKVLYIGTEAFTFTDVDPQHLRVTGCTRSAFGTSAAGHNVGDVTRWIQHTIYIAHGDSAVTAPATADADRKPMIDLVNSTNTSWVWTDYYSQGTFRTAQWTPQVISSLWGSRYVLPTTRTQCYGANHATNTDFSAIASEMGMSIKAANVGGLWRNESAKVNWVLSNPCGFTTVTVSGEKYRFSTSWPALTLQVSNRNTIVPITSWSEATPSAAATWENLSINATPTALGATYTTLRFVFNGSVSGTANNLAHAEFDSLTCALDSSNTPTATLGAETGEYFVDMKIENTTTDEYIEVRWLAAVDNPIVIDCENKTAVDYNGTNIRAAVTIPEVRQHWMTLNPGVSNSITVTETGLADVDITFSYPERAL